ncbi:MAG: hypothetical protein JWM47_2584 [Acidimicrobiales bacterium]|nr:hypothetical protein [Acidimicrobiales bacterium]
MAKEVHLDPEFERIVERARAMAIADGEILTEPSYLPPSTLSPEARAALDDWVTSGDFDRAIAEITADDPDIATQ